MAIDEFTPASQNVRQKRVGAKPSRVDLVTKEFNNLLEDQGAYVRITPSVLCPNRDTLDSSNHVLDCPICYGDEVVDLVGDCQEDWALIQGINLEKQMLQQGIFDLKDAQITTRSSIRLYYWYKVEVLDFSSPFNQLIQRGTLDYDFTRYSPVKDCSIPYYCIDSTGKRYRINEHFEIEDRKIRWRGLVRPDQGKLYSITYPILPTFRVIEMLHDNRYYYVESKQTDKIPVQLPQQALIRWDYLSSRSGSNVTREG